MIALALTSVPPICSIKCLRGTTEVHTSSGAAESDAGARERRSSVARRERNIILGIMERVS
jgi:hypothetical protein